MQNNNFDLLIDFNIEYLKNQLKGEPVNMQKGVKLEEVFNLCITNVHYNGDCLEDLNKNNTLFNYRKSPRSFQVNIAGLVNIKDTNEDISTSTEETGKTTYKGYKCEFLKYDFFDENGTVKMDHEEIKIEYEISKMKFTDETKKIINLDLCKKIKDIGKNKASRSASNVFERAKSVFDEENDIKELFKEYEIGVLKNYYNELLSFSFILKNRFNHSQKGYPNLIKFSQIKGKNKLYFFHATFIREIDGAYKVISNYNLKKSVGIEEKIFDEKKKKDIFFKNDILLFELKDTKTQNYCLNCMYDNYEVLNGYVKTIKTKNDFKDCEFYYIGIQEGKEEAKEKDDKNKIEGILKIKLFFFYDSQIFGQNYNEMNIEKLKTLNLLKDEFSGIEKKFSGIEKKISGIEKKISGIEKKNNIILFILIILIIIILIKKN